MKPATKSGAFNSHAEGLYKNFHSLMDSIKEAGTKEIRSMWEQDLAALHKEAVNMLADYIQYIHPINQSKLKILTSRPPEEWSVLARNGNSTVM